MGLKENELRRYSPRNAFQRVIYDASVAIFAAGCALGNPNVQKPTPNPEIVLIPEQQLIEQESHKLNLTPDQFDINQWARLGYDFDPLSKTPLDENNLRQAQKKLGAVTILLLATSSHPSFKRAGEFFQDKLIVRYNLDTNPHSPRNTGNQPITVGIDADKAGNTIYPITIPAAHILNESSAVSFASELAAQIERVRRMNTFQETLPNNTPLEERRRKEEERLSLQGRLQENADILGFTVQAYLESYALNLPGTRLVPFSLTKDASEYIKAGRNPKNPQWLSYVSRKLQPAPTLPTPTTR